MSSAFEAPKLELKPLPQERKYAFLGKAKTCHVIISSKVNFTQESELLKVIKLHKDALGWAIAD